MNPFPKESNWSSIWRDTLLNTEVSCLIHSRQFISQSGFLYGVGTSLLRWKRDAIFFSRLLSSYCKVARTHPIINLKIDYNQLKHNLKLFIISSENKNDILCKFIVHLIIQSYPVPNSNPNPNVHYVKTYNTR